MQTIHKTVLLKETIEALNLKNGAVVIDATLGGGGHSKAVIEKIGENGKLIAFDQDINAIKRFEKQMKSGSIGISKTEIFLINKNFSNLKDGLASLGFESVDAILADLGISSDQLADVDRGISFVGDAPLDMRMDIEGNLTAETIVNDYSQEKLLEILRELGEEKNANSIVRKIVAEREQKRITRTSELVLIIESAVPGFYKRKKLHPATKTFQALRMEVNKELDSLRSFLFQAIEILKPGGRLAIISFHSGEDSLVKSFFRENARGCICPPEFPQCRCDNKASVKILTRKAIVASEEELEENPRARSAKLRVVEKILG
ncbi:MAG: 16S rRNA (cytosine(1402)-N(4))-methyltransferase RsmH [Candidatus Moranbacteria bacterium]|nr:16S rRNA (cytosine(1402)-N(4))-methyltransferase RsmH [Candidatus Moranbacteria bacterium]